MNHSSMSPKQRVDERASKLNIPKKVLNDAFRILDGFRRAEFGEEWPDFDRYSSDDDEEFSIPDSHGRRRIGTGVSVNVIPKSKNHYRGRCCDILFVHITEKANRAKQQEIITEAGQHVSRCDTQIVIIHGTMDYYVWNKNRHQLKNQLVLLQPIKHSWLVLDPDWR